MSHILRASTVGNVEPGGQHPQPASGKETSGATQVPSGEISTLRRVLDEAELQVILRTLQYTGWNRKRAAVLLKISYRGLLYKIRRHSITPPLAGD